MRILKFETHASSPSGVHFHGAATGASELGQAGNYYHRDGYPNLSAIFGTRLRQEANDWLVALESLQSIEMM